MLPDHLVSTYREYKRDTDAIASWLASTAKAAGFEINGLSDSPTQTVKGQGRLKGKARKQAKQATKKPAAASQSSAKYVIRIRDFTVLAKYILEKALAVPLWFKSALDRTIAARAGFAAKLEQHGCVADAEADAKHERFVDVLKHVRVVLKTLMDIAQVLLGLESFFAGGEKPQTLLDQFNKYSLQMGISAAALGREGRKGSALASKAGPRGLKINAPVTTMFEERYCKDTDVVLTAEEVYRIVQISAYEKEVDDGTGRTLLGQIEDEQKLKEKKRLHHELVNRAKRPQAAYSPLLSPGELTHQLANALQAETLEFSFPYMMLHWRCWRLFRHVRDTCDPQLRRIFGPDYLESESQLSTLTGYLLNLACGAGGHASKLEPLKAAGYAMNEMLASGSGRFINEQIFAGMLSMGVEITVKNCDEEAEATAGRDKEVVKVGESELSSGEAEMQGMAWWETEHHRTYGK